MNSARQAWDSPPGDLGAPIYLDCNATTPHALFARGGRHNWRMFMRIDAIIIGGSFADCPLPTYIARASPFSLFECCSTRMPSTLKRAQAQYFTLYELRHTFATHLSTGGVADEWVTHLLRQGDAKVFKKYSQMKLQMMREALNRLNRRANEGLRLLAYRRRVEEF